MILRDEKGSNSGGSSTNSLAFLNNLSHNIISSRQSKKSGMDSNMIVEEDFVDFTRAADQQLIEQAGFLASAANDEQKRNSSISYKPIPKQSNTSFLTTPKQHKQLTQMEKENIDPSNGSTPFFAKARPQLRESGSIANSQPR